MAFRLATKRWAMGFNAGMAVVFAALLVVMVNYLSYQYRFRIDLSQADYFTLSPATTSLLEHLPADVNVVVFLSPSHDLYRDIRHLFNEYEHASNRIHIEYVDPNRDLARTKELALKYGITESDVVVFDSDEKRKIVSVKEIADYDVTPMMSGRPKRMTSFRGEQMFSSAIQSLTQAPSPAVYFLVGHGERQIDNYDQYTGYSIIARSLLRKNMQVSSLQLRNVSAIPGDCKALVVAGPSKRLSRAELDMIESYLDKSGRLFLLLDPGTMTGLDGLLEAWGVRLAKDVVIDGKLTLTGREMLVIQYGSHPITAHLDNITSIFHLPRSVQPLVSMTLSESKSADKPRVIVLASCSEQGWAEMTPDQNPPTFDSGVDRSGPIPVAVAVEKGILGDMDVEIKPTRIVVIGDSAIVSNGALLAGYNPDFFISALNWLLEREDVFDIAVREPATLRVIASRGQIRAIYWMIVVAIPGTVALLGLVVLFVRRK